LKRYAAIGVLVLSGCALLDPYKSGQDAGLYERANYGTNCDTQTGLVGHRALTCALGQSVKLQSNYLDAAGQHEIV